jgi:hypothetical protein
MRRPERATERGTTLVELMVGTVLFAVLGVLLLSAGGTMAEVFASQQSRTAMATGTNVVRTRILGDARSATAAGCADGSTLSITVGTTLVEYSVSNGELLRWSLPPDHASLVAENVSSLSCTSYGADGVLVDVDLGTTESPYHLYVRISDT